MIQDWAKNPVDNRIIITNQLRETASRIVSSLVSLVSPLPLFLCLYILNIYIQLLI